MAELASDHRAGASLGSPRYLGTTDCTTTSKTNAQATTAYPASGDLSGKCLLIYNASTTVDVHVHPVSSSTGTVTTNRTGNHGAPVKPGSFVEITMGGSDSHLAAITASSTANLDVWELS
jgi:hypothetical protein